MLDAEDLRAKLTAIRLYGHADDPSEIAPLLSILGYEHKRTRTDGQVDALLIKFVSECVSGEKNRDILLMAFRLLHGYEEIANIGSRRELYVQKSGFQKSEEATSAACERLRKKEDRLIAKLADAISNISDMKTYVEDVADYVDQVTQRAKLPIPSYLIEDEALNLHPTNIRILTPNASRWDNSHILGRDIFVSELCYSLVTTKQHLQLTGMGGIGKTEILNKVYCTFADNHIQHCFDYIGLFSYNGSIDVTMSEQLDHSLDTGDVEAVWRFLRELCEKFSILLLIDDIRPHQKEKGVSHISDESFSKLFSLNATTLFASRVPAKRFHTQTVNPLSMDECVAVFETQRHMENDGVWALTDQDKAVLEDIIKNLAGQNTLIVNRFGAMARDYGWSIQKLADKLKQKDFDIRKGASSEEKLQEEINKLYSLEYLKDSSERNILEAFALFPIIPINQDICAKWLCEDAGLDEDDCCLVLNKLAKHTWLMSYVSDEDKSFSFSMHQLVKSAVNEQAVIRLEDHLHLLECCYNEIQFSATTSFRRVWQAIPFSIALIEHFSTEEDTSIISVMNRIAAFYYRIGKHDRAFEWSQKTVVVAEKLLGPEAPYTSVFYSNMGQAFAHQKDFAQALEWLQKALAILQKAFGTDHYSVANTYNSMAKIHAQNNDYAKAFELFQRALDIHERTTPVNYTSIIAGYRCIAMVFETQGDCMQSLEWYQKALDVCEKNQEIARSWTSIIYNDIARIYRQERKYTEAEKWYQKAFVISEEIFGTHDSRTAFAINNIAAMNDSRENYTKAVEGYQKAFAICEQSLGIGHPETTKIMKNLASAYHSQKDYAKAINIYIEILAIQEEILGADHINYAEALSDIASVYVSAKNHAKALDLYLSALPTYEKARGVQHSDTVDLYLNIAMIHDTREDYCQALEWYKKALAACETTSGTDSLQVANIYRRIAGVYESQNLYAEATKWYQRTLDVHLDSSEPKYKDIAQGYYDMAVSYYWLDDHLLALECFQKSLSLFEKVYGINHPKTALVYRGIANVCVEYEGKHLEAREWYTKALDIQEKVLGTEHMDTADTYLCIAFEYFNQSEPMRSLEFAQQALHTYELALGNNHPIVINLNQTILFIKETLRANQDVGG